MPRYKMNCLASDRMVEWLEKRGFHAQATTVTGDKYQEALNNKLVEEANEVADAKTRDEIVEELGDVAEVIKALCALHNITPEQIEAQRAKKHIERGGFQGGVYLTSVFIEKNSPQQEYFDRHPEYELIEE